MTTELEYLAERIRNELVELEFVIQSTLFLQVRKELLAFAEFLEQQA